MAVADVDAVAAAQQRLSPQNGGAPLSPPPSSHDPLCATDTTSVTLTDSPRGRQPPSHMSKAVVAATATTTTTTTTITQPRRRRTSPLFTLQGIDGVIDLDSLPQLDVATADLVRVLQHNLARLRAGAVGRRWAAILRRQQLVVDNLIDKYHTDRNPEFVKQRDKVAFVLGVTNMWVTSLLIGVCPEVVPWVYIAKAVVLLAIRMIVYRKKRWHYFMFDMCYFVNALLMLCITVPGCHPHLWIAMWGLANGPVLTAITAWRNSLVFHSLDKVTSLLIHIEPPITTYLIRYRLPAIAATKPTTFFAKLIPKHLVALATTEVSFETFVFTSLATYVFWQACYFVFVWTLKADNIRNGYATSTTWLLADQKSIISQVTKNFGEASRPYLFMLIQLVYTLLTLLPAYVVYRSSTMHFLFIALSMFVATWNGANYYFEVFSRKYVGNLEKLRTQMEDMSNRGIDPQEDRIPPVEPTISSSSITTEDATQITTTEETTGKTTAIVPGITNVKSRCKNGVNDESSVAREVDGMERNISMSSNNSDGTSGTAVDEKESPIGDAVELSPVEMNKKDVDLVLLKGDVEKPSIMDDTMPIDATKKQN